MKRRMLVCVAGVVGSTLTCQAQAQFTAKAAAGLVAARGNSDTDTANAKLEITREIGRWKHAFESSGVYAADDTGATAQRWDARQQVDFRFHERGFWFESLRYEEDRFSGFEYQATAGTGFGWHFFDSPITKLSVQIGAGYKTFRSRPTLADDEVTLIAGSREEELIGQSTVDLEHHLSETTKVLADLLIEAGADNTFVQNDWSLQVKMLGSLALALGFSVRYNTDPPLGFATTDTLTTLNLVYEIL